MFTGYADDVTEIMKYLPKICQGFLMSATLSPELDALKKVVLHSPAVLKLEEEDAKVGKFKEGNLTQFFLALPKYDKNLVIYVFLKVSGKLIIAITSSLEFYTHTLKLDSWAC